METKAEVIMSISLLIFFTIYGHAQAEDEITVPKVIPQQNELANAANSLGYKIMTKMLTDSDTNIVLSPTGISGLLAMALAGSVGKTYDELATALGFSQDIEINRQNHETFGGLLKNLNSENTSSKTIYADAIFIDTKTKLREIYQSYVRRVYNGEAQSIDFADKETTQTLINQWVSNNTNGKLPDFLKKPLPNQTKAALVSALYFSGQWATPFVPEYTQKMPFKRTKDEVMTDMMLNVGNFNYTLKNNVEMIALPYNDSETVLYALKPRRPEKQNLSDLLSTLDYEKINDLVDKLTVQKCVIRFPKMDIKFFANLENPLKALGIETIFNVEQANFALMIADNRVKDKNETEILSRFADGDGTIEKNNLRSVIDNLPNPHLYIDSIIHDVRIKIDEYGTEAVAATSGILARTAQNFYANSPFYIFIRNEKTKLVTFSAAIFDPTK